MQKKSKSMLRKLAVALMSTLLMTQASELNSTSVLACTTLSECNNEISQAQQQRKELENEVAKIKSTSNDLEAEIYNFQLQVATFTVQIKTAEEEMKSLEEQRIQIQQIMNEIETKIRERFVNNQLHVETDKSLNFIANSSSITEMIERSQAMNTFLEADKEMIQEYDFKKQAVEENKNNTEKVKQELEKYKVEKEAVIEKNKALLQEYKKAEEDLEKKISGILETEQLSQAEIDKIKEAAARVSVTTGEQVNSGGGFVGYPIKSAVTTAYYNSTDAVHTTPHSGVDYAPLGDRTLYSLVDGVVVKNEFMQYGFGWYIVIAFKDSDGWKTLLYGHMEGRSGFGVGSTITRGQAIGITGTTGNSTGVHLHLELSTAGAGPSFVFQPTGSALKFDASKYFGLPYKW